MKNLKVILFALSVTIFASCDDAIDIKQPSELAPEDTFETIADMQIGLNGVYGAANAETPIIFTSLYTDEAARGSANQGQGVDEGLSFRLPADSGYAQTIWLSNYYMINLANRLIAASEFVVVEPGSEDETKKNNILAQAHALRAYGHFQLLTYFSTDLKDDNALGVILLDFVPDITSALPRSTNGEVFALIDSDLAFAAENLLEVAITDRGYVSHNFIKAFKARMAAYRGQYQIARDLVDELDVPYNLSNKTAYQAIWEDVETGPSSEVIFKFNRAPVNQSGNFVGAWASIDHTANGSPLFEVDRGLFNLFNFPQDVRRVVIVDESATVMTNYDDPSVTQEQYLNGDILPVGKYPGSENQKLLNDVKIFRFSEMVLIRAEYFASIGDYNNVITEINKVRFARTATTSQNLPANSISTAPAAWAAILQERRIELAFEGHRYIDVKRLGQLAQKGIERHPRDCGFNSACSLPATDYRLTMPIPQSEGAANNNIVQNPGY